MASATAARRYAMALFSLAQEQNSVEDINRDLQEIGRLIDATAELQRLIADPVIPPDKARQALHMVFADRVHDLTRRFLDFLIEKDRLEELSLICRIFATLSDEAQNIVHATITTARPLSEQHLDAIRARLEAKTGKQVVTEQIVEPELIGGFAIQMGDEVTDLTVRGQLQRLEQNIINA